MDIYNPVPITDSAAIKALQTKVTSLNTVSGIHTGQITGLTTLTGTHTSQITALQAVNTANATQINTNAIDSVGSTLTIGGQNTTQNVNVGTGTGVQTLNIGTGSGTTMINVGGANDTVSIAGTLATINTTNVTVSDKLFTLNKGGLASSAFVTGVEIEEGGTITGYARTSADRLAWDLKAPGNATVIKLDQAVATTSTPTFAGLGISGVSKLATVHSAPTEQGSWITWNRSVGLGTMGFVNQRGQGIGGFEWLNYDSNNALISVGMTLTAAGALSCASMSATTFTGNLVGNASSCTTIPNLTGEVTSVGNATTLTNSAAISKVLTGYTIGSGVLAATDSILGAFSKIGGTVQTLGGLATGTIPVSSLVTLNGTETLTNKTITGTLIGNASTVTTNANLTGEVTSVGNATTLTNAAVTGKLLTGLSLSGGTVSASDSILSAIGKNSAALNSATTAATANTLMLRDVNGSVTVNVINGAKASIPFVYLSNSSANKMLAVYDNNNGVDQTRFDFSGFGISTNAFRYQSTIGADHVFFNAITSTTNKELLRLTPNGDATMAGAFNCNSIKLVSTGATASSLDFYATQSFATTFTGPYTTATITFRLTRIGNVVTVTTVGGSTGTSTVATSLTSSTAVPSAYRSTAGAPLTVIKVYNGSSTSEAGYVTIGSTGFIDISPFGVNFAGSGLVGFDNFSCFYVIS